MDEVKNPNNDLEHKEAKNIQSEQEKKKSKKPQKTKNEDGVSNLWDNFKHSNIGIIGVPEKKRKSKKLEIYLKK